MLLNELTPLFKRYSSPKLGERDLPVITSLSWRDGSSPLLASVDSHAQLRIWDKGGNELDKIHAHSQDGWANVVRWIKFIDAWFLVTGGDANGEVRIFRWADGLSFIKSFKVHCAGWVSCLDVGLDDRSSMFILSGSSQGYVSLAKISRDFEMTYHKESHPGQNQRCPVMGLAMLLPEGHHEPIAVWKNGCMKLFDEQIENDTRTWNLGSGVSSFGLWQEDSTIYGIVGTQGGIRAVKLGPESEESWPDTKVSGSWAKGLYQAKVGAEDSLIGGLDGNIVLWKPRRSRAVDGFPRMVECIKIKCGQPIESLACVLLGDTPLVAVGGECGEIEFFGVRQHEPDYTATVTPDIMVPADKFGRRKLATHLISVIDQLVAGKEGSDSTIAILVDGKWGSGKSVFGRYVVEQLRSAKPTVARNLRAPIIINFNCWRESRVAPYWWSLSAALHSGVTKKLCPHLRILLWLAELKARVGVTRNLAALLGILALWLTSDYSLPEINHFQHVVTITIAGGAVWTLGTVVYKALFWASPLVGRIHMNSESAPAQDVENIIRVLRSWSFIGISRRIASSLSMSFWLLLLFGFLALPVWPLIAWSFFIVAGLLTIGHSWIHRRSGLAPILLILDDIDRCDAEAVVEFLETVQTLFRSDSMEFLEAQVRSETRVSRKLAPLVVLVLGSGVWLGAAFEQMRKGFLEYDKQLGGGFLNRIFDYTLMLPEVHLGSDLSRSFAGSEETLGSSGCVPDVVAQISRDFCQLLPRNPRMIRRVAGTYLMLRENIRLDGQFSFPAGLRQTELLVRAAILVVEEPMLVRQLLWARSVPVCRGGKWAGEEALVMQLKLSPASRLFFSSEGEVVLQPADLLRCFGRRSFEDDR